MELNEQVKDEHKVAKGRHTLENGLHLLTIAFDFGSIVKPDGFGALRDDEGPLTA